MEAAEMIGGALFVLFFVLMGFGLVLCRKYSFTAGFYFFLVILIGKVVSLWFPLFIGRHINSLAERNQSLAMGMSIGQLLSWVSLVPLFFDVLAFSILVIGLYRWWKTKTAKHT